MRRWIIPLVAVGVLFFLYTEAHYYCRYSAWKYGHDLSNSILLLGWKNSDAQVRDMLDSPRLERSAKWVRGLGLLTFDNKHPQKIADIRAATTYLYQQLNLPEEQRFSSPLPPMKYIKIDPQGDHSETAVVGDMAESLNQYNDDL